MPLRATPILIVLLGALSGASVSAQSPDWCVLEGERIRIHTTSDFTPQGLSLGCAEGSLLIRPEAGDGSRGGLDRAVLFSEVESVDVSRGYERPVLSSVLVGGSLGAAAFGGFAYLTGDDGESCGEEYCVRLTRERKAVWGAVAGLLLGAGGGLMHGLNQESEIWRPWPEVPLGQGTAATLRPWVGLTGDVGLGVRVRF